MLTGLVVPLPGSRRWAQAVLWWTPFPALLQSPIDVFTERGDPLRGCSATSWCGPWCCCSLGRVVLARGARRLVVQGG